MIGRFFRKWFGRRPPAPSGLSGPLSLPPPDGDAAPPAGVLHAADIEDRFYRLVFGFPPSSLGSLSSAEQAVLRRVRDAFGGERVDPGALPRAHPVLPTLMRSLRGDGPDARALLTQVESDRSLMAEVIQAANHPRDGATRPVIGLSQVVALLGQDGLHRAMVRVTMRSVLCDGTAPTSRQAAERLWEHAERCAQACTFLDRKRGDALEAYLAGLVSQAGVQVMLQELARRDDTATLDHSRAFVAAIAQQVERISLHAARHWALPSRVVQALAERADPADAGARTPLGRVLLAGSRLAMLDVLVEQGLAESDAGLRATAQQGISQSSLTACRDELRGSASAGVPS
ncbi:HDOD domain-containing protein [Luteibacter sp. CQ10]|uniref:HDOD domain-containing protein n=1 Tax=Luteibacter sp. CQ10 TaxID=2805821 RepID=UPI0034A5111B